MKMKELTIFYSEFNNPGELLKEDSDLFAEAEKAISRAYAPYSGFKVGAAALLGNGEIITGNNQENAAYPSGLCAERVALFFASSQFPDVPVKTIAISAIADKFQFEGPLAPCGSCRQVMAETENRFHKKLRVIMKGISGKIYLVEGVNNLLPWMFIADELKK
jgi:cytidine deaminase